MQRDDKIISLEALRGYAAFVVVLHHFFLCFLPQYDGMIPENISGTPYQESQVILGLPFYVFMNGSAGVVLFFVLSGYVLALKALGDTPFTSVFNTAFKRWFRLMPLVFCSLVISSALFYAHLYHFRQAAALSQSVWSGQFAFNTLPENYQPSLREVLQQGLAGAFLWGERTLNPVLWTMSWEFQGSFVILTLALLLGTKLRTLLWGIVPLVALYCLNRPGIELLFPFLIGFLLVMLPLKDIRLNKTATLVLGAAGLYLCGYFAPIRAYEWLSFIHFAPLRTLILSIGAGFILCVFASKNFISQRCQGPVSQRIGAVSFPLYLMHTLIIASFSSWGYAALGGGTIGVIAAALILLSFVIPLSTALALFDKSYLRLLAKWQPVRF